MESKKTNPGLRNKFVDYFHQFIENGQIYLSQDDPGGNKTLAVQREGIDHYCILERIKYNQARGSHVNYYFWRTYDQKEIDFIEESGGRLSAYEIKWKPHQTKPVKDFLNAYPGSEFHLLTRENFRQYLA